MKMASLAKAGSLRSSSPWASWPAAFVRSFSFSLSSSSSSSSSLSSPPSLSRRPPSGRPPRAHSAHSPPPSSLVLLVFVSLALSALCLPLVAASASSTSPSRPNSIFANPIAIAAINPALLDLSPLHKRAVPATVTSSITASATPKPTKTKVSTTSTSGVPVKSTMSTPSAAPTQAPDTKGDTALFGRPSVLGGYNLTTGILIYSAFMLVFVGAIGAATWRRAKYRSQFRQMQQRNMEGGRVLPGGKGSKKGGDAELSDAALFKQASMSKRALMTDVGPGGTITAHDAPVTKIAAANGAGRHFDESGAGISSIQSVRFGENNPNNRPPGTGRAGGMKASTRSNANQGDYEMNSYRQSDDLDTNDYSRPPLESADPYYSSGSSHSGYLDQVDNYQHRTSGSNTPQRPKLAYQQGSDSSPPQPQYQQPTYVQRTNSSRMPKNELHDGNNIFRSDSGGRGGATTPSRGVERSGSGGSGYPARIATQGLLDRSGSGGRSASNSPIEGGMSRTGSSGSSARTRVSPSPTQSHPTPIARSNSSRLPPSMRGGGAAPAPSGLGQQRNNFV